MKTLQEERLQPNLAPLQAEGAGVFWLLVCAAPEGELRPHRAAPSALLTDSHNFLI